MIQRHLAALLKGASFLHATASSPSHFLHLGGCCGYNMRIWSWKWCRNSPNTPCSPSVSGEIQKAIESFLPLTDHSLPVKTRKHIALHGAFHTKVQMQLPALKCPQLSLSLQRRQQEASVPDADSF